MISFNVLFIYEAPHRHLKSDQVDEVIIYFFFFFFCKDIFPFKVRSSRRYTDKFVPGKSAGECAEWQFHSSTKHCS